MRSTRILQCRDNGIEVPSKQVHQVEASCPLRNELTPGFWKTSEMGQYRLINQTAGCVGMPLLMMPKPFQPAQFSLRASPVPANLVDGDGLIKLTLVLQLM